MTGFFNPDNKLWSCLSSAVDAVLLNIMWLISCIPLLTVGAANTAFYYTTHKVIRNQRSSLWKEYWSSFRSNFKQATKLWLLFAVIFLVFYFDIRICSVYLKTGAFIGVLSYFFIALLAMVLVWFIYVFAYLARFENGSKETLKNAAIMAVVNLGYSLIILAVLVVAFGVCWVLPLFVWFVPAIAMVLLNRVLERVFRKYMSAEELLEEEENDRMRC